MSFFMSNATSFQFNCQVRTAKLTQPTAITLFRVNELGFFPLGETEGVLWAKLYTDGAPLAPFLVNDGLHFFIAGHSYGGLAYSL